METKIRLRESGMQLYYNKLRQQAELWREKYNTLRIENNALRKKAKQTPPAGG
jgi:hypothetical protein